MDAAEVVLFDLASNPTLAGITESPDGSKGSSLYHHQSRATAR